MKQILFVCITMILVLFSGCGAEDKVKDAVANTLKDDKTTLSSETVSNFDESLRGEWIYVHNGEKVYIDENFEESIVKIDDKLLEIEKDGVINHLIRYGVNDTTVKGNLYQEEDTKRSISRALNKVGNINVILKHHMDHKNDKTQILRDSGEFEFTDVKTGKYILQASTEDNISVEAEVDIYGEEISLGGFKLVSDDGYNFKTEFIINNSKGGYLFGDQNTYNGTILIKNIGTKKGRGLNYTFNSDSPYIANISSEIVLGTVDVNKSIEIPFSVTFNILDKTTVSIPLNVTIKDANGNEWLDTIFLHVYQTPMYVNITTKEANVKGYIIENAHELKQINTSNSSIVLPYKAGESYYLVLSNPNIDSETPYSIGVDVETLPFDTFRDTSAHEPNNKEIDAKSIKVGESTISYLHESDIDYFIIDMSNSDDVGLFSPPQMPFK